MSQSNDPNMTRMHELVNLLTRAAKSYYAQDEEIMSNWEYDRLYDELAGLEKITGVILPDSPTRTVGYEAVESLPKERHEKPMLSLGKTKSREELQAWLNGREGLLSWKLDGLTIVLTYQGGQLVKAVTRGNGEVGEVITANARTFKNLPLSIPFQGNLVLRGEAVIRYSDFEAINQSLPETEEKYKNPRNLCSGSVRQLDSRITAERNVRLYAFALVSADGVDFSDSREEQFRFLAEQGFDVVEYRRVNPENIPDAIRYFEEKIQTYDVPSDGLVLLLDEIAYGESLGRTAKFPRNSIAFKWADELQETTLRDVEWSPSRTGLINPVAIFDPVELEGTTVSRASVHNVSIVRQLKLGIGDKILVYKANMIIPQIAENKTGSGTLALPDTCPACGGKTALHDANGVQSLFCENPACPAKKIKAFTLFVSRDALNIDGLSEATLEKFIGRGFLHCFGDIFRLGEHQTEICAMEGFGEKSCANLLESLDKARDTNPVRLLYGLGIAGVGLSNAKVICRYFHNDLKAIETADTETFSEIDGVGDVIGGAIYAYFHEEENLRQLADLLQEIHLSDEGAEEESGIQNLAGMSFVVTGSLNHFENRSALQEEIERRGGKVTGSVTAKTVCLINNDVSSASSKNQKAKALGIPIVSEDDFMAQYLS